MVMFVSTFTFHCIAAKGRSIFTKIPITNSIPAARLIRNSEAAKYSPPAPQPSAMKIKAKTHSFDVQKKHGTAINEAAIATKSLFFANSFIPRLRSFASICFSLVFTIFPMLLIMTQKSISADYFLHQHQLCTKLNCDAMVTRPRKLEDCRSRAGHNIAFNAIRLRD